MRLNRLLSGLNRQYFELLIAIRNRSIDDGVLNKFDESFVGDLYYNIVGMIEDELKQKSI